MKEYYRMTPKEVCKALNTNEDGLTEHRAEQIIKEKGLNIPEDIAVVGFSNTKRSRYMNPTVSSINQFPEKIGRAAAELLFDQILNELARQLKSPSMRRLKKKSLTVN